MPPRLASGTRKCNVLGTLAVLALACSEPQAVPGTTVRLDFGARGELYAAPVPSEHLRSDAGAITLSGFPNPGRVDLVAAARRLIEADADGFGLTSAIYLPLTGPLAETSLPGLFESTTDTARAFVVAIDSGSPDFGVRAPVLARFLADPGPFGAPNLLALLPLQGRPLRPKTTYAAVLLRSAHDAAGEALGVSLAMAQLAAGVRPEGLGERAFAEYRRALETLERLGTPREVIAGLAVFTTGDPAAAMQALVDVVRAEPSPQPEGPLALSEVFEDFCVYTSTLALPDFQEGTPPFTEAGGGIQLDASGRPILQRHARSRLVLTVPRRPMPQTGYPTAVFIRTGGGGDRPLVDRGVRALEGGPAVEPGEGPARYFARAGFAGASIDGPHGGLRNPRGADEQFLVFNVFNPVALRDNLRQSALELALLAHVLEQLELDASACPGAGSPNTRLDATRLALMGHSMGASIAPLVLATEPRYRAAILSGAGASWIENVLHKERPLPVRGIAELTLGYTDEGRPITAHDPALSLIQWAGEAADPPLYARQIIHEAEAPRHVLMFQGIVDRYIMPPIANALSLSLGLDLAGPALEPSLGELLPLSGRREVPLPARGNLPGGVTGLVVQHAEDGVEDGHEVVFQTEAPKRQYRCFLESLVRGEAPRVPAAAPVNAPCTTP